MKCTVTKPASPPLEEPTAYGAAKEAWKADGNRYAAEELRALSRAAGGEFALRPGKTLIRRAD
ncbi:MAG TPA: hypothetical protein VMB21_19340 [Candidatus Limnocylindria bacterium]|nr:hypothetical protein [Candidatus Limnocylindria bacterium]